MSEPGKLHDTPEASSRRRSSVVTPGLQFSVDQDRNQERDAPAEWEKAGNQTGNSELSDFLVRVSSINGLDSTRYIGGKIRKGS